ncbi:hypothetical protein ACFLSE_06680 [Bacteroidota bacterium]
MKTKLFLILLLVFPSIAFTQGTWTEYNKEVNTGLIQGGNIMSHFTESKDGSIWVSNTTGSIVRILGDDITIYDNLKRSIAAQTNIGTLVNAREKTIGVWWFSQADMESGWVWFASNRGIVLWDNEKLLFLTGETDPKGHVILLDEQTGTNYIINNNIIEKTDAVKNVNPTKDMYNFYSVYIDSKKRVWFGGSAGRLYCIENGIWKIWNDITNSNYSNDDKTVRKIFEDKKGTIYVVCHGILWRIDNNTIQFDDKLPNLKDATGGFADSKGNIWISGTKGVYKFSEGNWIFYGASEGIDAIPVAGPIIEDKEGNIWFAGINTTIFTKSTGIFILKPIGAVYKYDGRIWTKYSVVKKNLITDLYADNQGEVWATESIGVYKFDGDQFVLQRNCSKTRSFIKIFQDTKGNIWVGRGSFKGEIDKYTN